MYQTDIPKKNQLIAKITTNFGDIEVCLFEQEATKCVENFVTHAKNGYYDNTVFHRVIKDFMIQGGDPLGSGYGGNSIWNKSFGDEFSDKLKNIRGALSMANSGPNTNGSQFFIVQNTKIKNDYLKYLDNCELDDEQKSYYKENGGCFWLDGKHSVFGQVLNGMEIVDKIAEVRTDNMDRPVEDVVINSIEIYRYQ
ncbi:peptidylprolyl isomerase [uncultured Finegoldia sp.]|uniref:peptidylprolyl isomerase n=1 Tax=uncultured Finegoldia sp. TaxID=328009 RepID=UPI002635DCB6|nr:peptidylprolyl isomerase [uncultured Finegoldia sp.]